MDLEFNKTYCENSITFCKTIPNGFFDLIMTDFPYGVGYEYGKTYTDTEENLTALITLIMPELFRIVSPKGRIVITCGHTNINKYSTPKWIMAWVNSAGVNRNSWGFTCWQPILCYGKDPYLQNRMGARHDIIMDNSRSDKTLKHSCPKPIPFWEKLLLRSSVKETDKVFDPFMGSGTTAFVCKKNNRQYIGCDINPEFVNIANNR